MTGNARVAAALAGFAGLILGLVATVGVRGDDAAAQAADRRRVIQVKL